MSYAQERRVFDRLRSDISEQVKTEYEGAFNVLIERYNTTIRENRFIVGGALEVFTCALLRTVGIECDMYGSQATHGDIILPHQKMLSIKGIFKGGAQDVTLLNKQGKGTREWKTATLFVVSEVGIVYGTPDMVQPLFIQDRTDAIVLHKKALQEIMQNDGNVIPMKLSKKPPTEMAGFAFKASMATAKQIMHETKAGTLLSVFTQNDAPYRRDGKLYVRE